MRRARDDLDKLRRLEREVRAAETAAAGGDRGKHTQGEGKGKGGGGGGGLDRVKVRARLREIEERKKAVKKAEKAVGRKS